MSFADLKDKVNEDEYESRQLQSKKGQKMAPYILKRMEKRAAKLALLQEEM